MSLLSLLPLGVLADSYKPTHRFQYPASKKLVAYGEFRTPFAGLPSEDKRLVFYGIRYIVEQYLHRKWTLDDIEKVDSFYKTHNAGKTPFPWPKATFEKFVKENNGYFPVKIEALPEGSVVHTHTPVYQITAVGEYSPLCLFLETILTHVWYPSTVATLSRRTRDLIEEAFEETVDPDSYFLIDSRLHDFGFRGCTCVEQSVLGGLAHLLNFEGSDTMSAAYYAQFVLNNGKPVATSIPATEHSVMTSWPTESDAIRNMIDHFGSGVFACVMDSYDYHHALEKVLPEIAEYKVSKGGTIVLRPDSGDPVESVIKGLLAANTVFGSTVNKKGYKVINKAAVIQGDGINITVVKKILTATKEAGFSAQNVAFGMGGGLLQKVNRDTMGFATKLNFIEYENGEQRLVMKLPKTDSGKSSLPGILHVERSQPGRELVFNHMQNDRKNNLLQVVYDHGPIAGLWENELFDHLKERVRKEWKEAPPDYDPISPQLKEEIQRWKASQLHR